MRKLTVTLCLTILVCFTSSTAWSEGFLCSTLGILCPKTVDESQLVERQGLKYEVDSQTPFTGYVIEKYDDGKLMLKEHYKDGKRDGPWVSYHENGQLSFKGTYKDGKEEGQWVSFESDGTVNKKLTGTYKNGKKISD